MTAPLWPSKTTQRPVRCHICLGTSACTRAVQSEAVTAFWLAPLWQILPERSAIKKARKPLFVRSLKIFAVLPICKLHPMVANNLRWGELSVGCLLVEMTTKKCSDKALTYNLSRISETTELQLHPVSKCAANLQIGHLAAIDIYWVIHSYQMMCAWMMQAVIASSSILLQSPSATGRSAQIPGIQGGLASSILY